jgi:hypothetical protein
MVILALLALGSTPALAHDEFRIIGIVAKVADSRLHVKTREGKAISVQLDRQTLITRDKKKLEPKDLTAGLTVVVDAYGDTEEDSLALEIRIVPPIAAR